MSIFRDLGRSVSNLVRPDGLPSLDVPSLPSLAQGTARIITQAFTGNSAVINPSSANRLNQDPTKTPEVQTFGLTKSSNSGPPYDNILEQFASYAPLFTLACLEPFQFNQPDSYRGSPAGLKHIVLSSAGRYNSQRVNTTNGAPEYFIDNVNLTHQMVAMKGNTNVSGFSFDVYEPYSMGLFLQSLNVAAVNAGYPSYVGDVPYLLKLEFLGFDDRGRVFSSTEMLAKYFTIKITGSTMKVDEGGSRYTVQASPYHQEGFKNSVNVVPNNVTLSGETVKDVLCTGKNSLMQALNAAQFRLVDKNQIDFPDLYQIVFPIGFDDDVGVANGLSTEELRATVNPDAEVYGDTSSIPPSLDLETVDFGNGEIGFSSLGFEAQSGGNYVFKTGPDVIDPSTGRIQRDKMSIDPKQRTFQFEQNIKITDIINNIVASSKYCTESLRNEPDTLGMIDWFRIDVQTQIGEFDSKRAVNSRKYIFRIIPYKVNAMIFTNPTSATAGSAELEKIIAKKYDYIYTGQNNNLIKFDLVFDGMFNRGALITNANDHATIQNTDNQASTASDKTTAETQQGPSVTAAATETGTAPVRANHRIKTGTSSGDKTAEQIVANVFQDSFEGASNDMINVTADILGDPYFISDSGFCGNYISDLGPNSQITADGAMNYEGSDIFVYISFRTPVEPNLGTTGQGGLYNFPKDQYISPYSGIYKVIQVESKFKNGSFTQVLNLNRQQNQSIDYKGTEAIDKQTQLLYNTDKKEPPKSSVIDDSGYDNGIF